MLIRREGHWYYFSTVAAHEEGLMPKSFQMTAMLFKADITPFSCRRWICALLEETAAHATTPSARQDKPHIDTLRWRAGASIRYRHAAVATPHYVIEPRASAALLIFIIFVIRYAAVELPPAWLFSLLRYFLLCFSRHYWYWFRRHARVTIDIRHYANSAMRPAYARGTQRLRLYARFLRCMPAIFDEALLRALQRYFTPWRRCRERYAWGAP